MTDEVGWVIEFPMDQNGVVYYGRTVEGLGMTNENADAIRFSRKIDAEMVIEDVGWTEAKAVQHLWISEEDK